MFIPELNFHKGIALIKENKIGYAYKIMISLQNTDYKRPSAGYVRGIFKFYGCTSEHDIWGEVTEISKSISDLTGTENFPALTRISAEEIVEMRLRLAKGDMNIIGNSCPLNSILSGLGEK